MDDRVLISSNVGLPLVMQKGSAAGAAFSRIAKRLNGQENLPIQIPVSGKPFWKNIGLKLGIK
jgi:septum site-determining protein MinD